MVNDPSCEDAPGGDDEDGAAATGPGSLLPLCVLCTRLERALSGTGSADEPIAAKLLPATHTPGYIDRHNRFKDKLERETCTVCHGRDFRCLGCH